MKIILDTDKCTGCGVCTTICPQMILEVCGGKMAVKDAARCMGCFGCEDECPVGAVHLLRAPQSQQDIPIEALPYGITTCDVAVVGAGPSGLGAAIACARAGLDVVVFERLPNRKISHHVDGVILFTLPEITRMQVTPEHLLLPELDIDLSAQFARPCREFGLLGPLGLASDNRALPGMEAWASSKDRFIEALVGEAEKCGARFWFNARVVDVLREDDRICGIRLSGGETVRARVVVTADGCLGKISKKAGMKISEEKSWFVPCLALQFEHDGSLPASLHYLNGGMQWEPDMPPIFGAIGVTDAVHVLVAFLSRSKAYPAPKPMDYYVNLLLEKDPRIIKVLGNQLKDAAPAMISGCRGILRNQSNLRPVGNGVISIGDAWVDDGELGNIPSLANGVFAGRVIAEAAKKNDFSQEALSSVCNFISKKLQQALNQNKNMKLLPAMLPEEEMEQMFLFMKHINYPTLLLGNPSQQAAMFVKFFLKNGLRILIYPKLAGLIFS